MLCHNILYKVMVLRLQKSLLFPVLAAFALPVFAVAATPVAPIVSSQDFDTSGGWNTTKTGTFTWDLPEDVIKVAVEIVTEDETEPQVSFDPPISEFSVSSEDLKEGLQYLLVQFKNEDGWGEVATLPLLVDSKEPLPFVPEIIYPESGSFLPIITARTSDTTSGVSHYVINFGSDEVELTPAEAAQGFSLENLSIKGTKLKISAIDMAGNSRTVALPVLVVNQMSAESLQGSWQDLRNLVNMTHFTAIFLGALLVVLLLYIRSQRIEFVRKEKRLKREMVIAKGQTDKIFAALRDEIHEQLQELGRKSKVSKKDQEMIDSLHRALQVSETLIRRELDDVEEILN